MTTLPAIPLAIPELGDAQRMLDAALASPIPLGVGVVGGLVLLFAGAKLLRAGVVLLGLALGCGAGAWIAPRLSEGPILDVPSLWVGAGLGAIAGLLLGLAIFRFAMALTSSVACAGVGVLSAVISLNSTPGALPAFRPEPPRTHALISAAYPQSGFEPSHLTQTPAWNAAADLSRSFADNAVGYWNALPPQSRTTIVLGAIAGGLLGLLIGAIAPRRAAAIMTGLCGSGVLLACGVALTERMDIAQVPRWPLQSWLIAWAVVGVVGAAAQAHLDRRASRPASAD